MKAKICGLTNLADAQLASQFGAWALGFNFYRGSPRYITPAKAKNIIAALRTQTLKVGIFIDTPSHIIKETMHQVGLNLAQVYVEMEDFDKKLLILAIRPDKERDIPSIKHLKDYAYVLIDAPAQTNMSYGGTGQYANWKLARHLSKIVPLILAGGLKPDNIDTAIATVNPFAVDVCSGIESRPGLKSSVLLKMFLEGSHHA